MTFGLAKPSGTEFLKALKVVTSCKTVDQLVAARNWVNDLTENRVLDSGDFVMILGAIYAKAEELKHGAPLPRTAVPDAVQAGVSDVPEALADGAGGTPA